MRRTTMTWWRHSRLSRLSSSWPISDGAGGCQSPPDGNHPGARRQSLWRGHEDDDDITAAVRQLAIREKGYAGRHNGGAAATAHSPSRRRQLMPAPSED
jgi:hypothetical protein